jgi:hypothetical protein
MVGSFMELELDRMLGRKLSGAVYMDCFTLEDGSDTLSRNACN